MPDFAQWLPDKNNNKENIMGLYKQALDKYAQNMGDPSPTLSREKAIRAFHAKQQRERLEREGWDPDNMDDARIGTQRSVMLPTITPGSYSYREFHNNVGDVIRPEKAFVFGAGFRHDVPSWWGHKPVTLDQLLHARDYQARGHAAAFAPKGTHFNDTIYRAMDEAGQWRQKQMRTGQFDPKANAPIPDYLKNHKQYQMLPQRKKELLQLQLNNMVYNNNNNETGYRHA